MNLFRSILSWFDNNNVPVSHSSTALQPNIHAASGGIQYSIEYKHHIDYWRVIPFTLMHLACFAIIWVDFSVFAFVFAVVLYVIRMFAITGFYHRYFSHKAFQTSRFGQFLFAIIGATAVQRGPLWWAAHHRNHHAHSDKETDAHSPVQHGFWWSHVGWFLSTTNFHTQFERVKELAKFPELRFLDRFDVIVPILFALSIFGLGELLANHAPYLETDGWQLLVWGFAISTVVLYHATFSVNSLAHIWGKRRYITRDHSRNNLIIAIFTLGEGWHNNHHHYPGAAKQGFYWWEIDFTYYGLRVLAALGLIWNLRKIPIEIRESRKY
jgi:stearoyl-CoA desaturase (Delta-9 desaturase)